MQTRTGLVWMLLGLLSLSPLAAAQGNDDPYPIGIWAEHDHLSAAPGESASFALRVGTHSGPHNVTLSARALPDGLTGAFGSALVSPAPQAFASTSFVVSVAAAARAREPIAIMLDGVDEAGHSTSLRVYLRIAAPPTNASTAPHEPTSSPAQPPATTPPTPASSRPEFALFAAPANLKLAPGGAANVVVYLKANAPMHIDLQAVASAGFAGALSVASVDITPGEPTRLNLTVTADQNALSPGGIEVIGVSGEQKHAAPVHIELATPPAAEHSFMMRVEPASQTILAGGEAQFVVRFKAAHDITLALAMGRHSGEGYSARFEPASLDIPAGGEAKALLTVNANQTPDRYGVIQVLAKVRNATEQRDGLARVALSSPSDANTSTHTPPEAPAPKVEPSPPPTREPKHSTIAPSLPTAMLGNGIEIGIEGFDHAGGLRISVRVGDGNVMHVRLGPEMLRGVLRESKTGGDDVGHHSPLWIRLQLEDASAADASPAAGTVANA